MFRPEGWIDAGRERLERMRPIAERHGLTPLQLACQWNLAHAAVQSVVPTLIQEPGPSARRVEEKRDEVGELRRIGDNFGSMALKGATPDHEGPERPDRWSMDDELAQVAQRWSID